MWTCHVASDHISKPPRRHVNKAGYMAGMPRGLMRAWDSKPKTFGLTPQNLNHHATMHPKEASQLDLH